jgi:hypothetical protein
VDPLLGREVVERQQFLGVIDLLHRLRRAGLRGLRQEVPEIAGLVGPAPLVPGCQEDLGQGDLFRAVKADPEQDQDALHPLNS